MDLPFFQKTQINLVWSTSGGLIKITEETVLNLID